LNKKEAKVCEVDIYLNEAAIMTAALKRCLCCYENRCQETVCRQNCCWLLRNCCRLLHSF